MCLFFFFNDTATTEIYTYGHPLSLHDALPIWLDVHVLDRVTDGPKPQLVRDLGATYHAGALPEALAPDIVMECTGAAPVIVDAISRTAPSGIPCLAGISSGQHRIGVDIGDRKSGE